jgi:diguanylate cyclase (GGDEF)-like protein/PAS domain S-box-containing protein
MDFVERVEDRPATGSSVSWLRLTAVAALVALAQGFLAIAEPTHGDLVTDTSGGLVKAGLIAITAVLAWMVVVEPRAGDKSRRRLIADRVVLGALAGLLDLALHGLAHVASADAPLFAAAQPVLFLIALVGPARVGASGEGLDGRRLVAVASASVSLLFAAMLAGLAAAGLRADLVDGAHDTALLAIERQRAATLKIAVLGEADGPTRSTGVGALLAGTAETLAASARDLPALAAGAGLDGAMLHDGTPLAGLLEQAARRAEILATSVRLKLAGQPLAPGTLTRSVEALEVVQLRILEGLQDIAAHRHSEQAKGQLLWLTAAPLAILAAAFVAFGPLAVRIGRQEAMLRGRARDFERLALVVRHTRNAVIVCGADRRIVWVNAAFERLTGWSLEEVRGKSPGAVLQCEHTDRTVIEAVRAALDAGEDIRVEILNRARDGRLYWLDMDIQPERDATGAVVGFVAIESEVTEQAKLRQYLRTVFNAASAGLIILDAEGRVVDANPEAERLVGRSLAEVIGQPLHPAIPVYGPDGRPLAPEDRPTARALATGEPQLGVVIGIDGADGRRRWLQVNARRELDPQTARFILVVGFVDVTVDREREAHIRAARDRAERTSAELKAVFDNWPGGITIVDQDLQFLRCNERYRDLLDLPDSLFATGLPNLKDVFRFNAARGEYGPADVEETVRRLTERAVVFEPSVLERTRPNGVTIEIRGMPIPGGGFVTTYTDVSERRRAEDMILQKSRLAEEKSRQLEITMAHMTQGLSVFDGEGRLTLWNARYPELFDIPPARLAPGVPLRALLAEQRESGVFDGDVDVYLATVQSAVGRGEEVSFTTTQRSGRIIRSVHAPAPEGGWIATHEDVTDQVRAADRIAFAATHDLLTGVANRGGLTQRIAGELPEVLRRGGTAAVLLVDLDRFKVVNDTFGHAVGDRVLEIAAERMRAHVRPVDMIARFGGDEFAVYCGTAADQREASVVVASRLLTALSAPYDIDGRQIFIGASIGIALAPDHGTTADTLIRNADSALYEVKTGGRNGLRIFDERLEAAARERRDLEADLRDALARDEFELHYQPIVSVIEQRVVGMEALLRWRHPERGYVPPDVFIPIAEQTGLIGPIGRFVIATACADAAGWPEPLSVAINVSPAQLGQHDLVEMISAELLRTRLSPDRVEIEVTETVLLGNDELLLGVLHQLRSLDIRIALDDFGTGYSSLSYLRLFPFDKIKIDRSFVADIESSPHCAAIVCAVASLARSLGITTTAEGVETEEQFALLSAAGCTTVQGYLFGRPRPAREIDLGATAAPASRRLSA